MGFNQFLNGCVISETFFVKKKQVFFLNTIFEINELVDIDTFS